MNLSKLVKALLLALAAAVVSKKLKPKAKNRIEEMARPDSTPAVLKPLEPITRAYWILHPQKALYLWLFQKSFGFAWSLAKRYFGK